MALQNALCKMHDLADRTISALENILNSLIYKHFQEGG